MSAELSPLAQHIAKTLFAPGGRFGKPCCDLHQASGCCDPDDCGPCCERCPTCPTLNPVTGGSTPESINAATHSDHEGSR